MPEQTISLDSPEGRAFIAALRRLNRKVAKVADRIAKVSDRIQDVAEAMEALK